MKKVTLILILAFVMLGEIWAVDLADAGFQVLDQRREAGITTYDVIDSFGRRYTVGAPGEFTDAQIRRIRAAADWASALELVDMNELRIVFEDSGDVADLLVVPSSFVYSEFDLAPFIPSGMSFVFGDVIEYNFRMFVDGLFLRLEGQFFIEEQFADRLVRAAQNPAVFVQSLDPEFLFLRISELEGQVEALLARINDDEAALAASIEEMTARFDEADTTVSGLAETQSTLRQEFDRARYGTLMHNNRGFFGGVQPGDPAVIARIVELKSANSALTVNEMVQTLRGEELQATAQLVRLVFFLYFNDFQ